MIASMTGYGAKSALVGALAVHVEIKALNSKNLDIHVDAPKQLDAQLFHWQKTLGKALKRGRIHITIDCRLADLGGVKLPDEAMIRACYGYLHKVATNLKAKGDLFGLTLQLLGKGQSGLPIEENTVVALEKLLNETVEECIINRKKEGENLAVQLENCLEKLTFLLGEMVAHLPKRTEKLRERLEEKIKTREGTVDNNRWEQEVLYYLEKINIEEECVRFRSHLDYFKDTMTEKSISCGKKLGFIVQEMLREVNTVGAKAQDFSLQKLVIEMKQVLEEMREQVCNIL